MKASALKRLARTERGIPAEADLILLGDSLAAGWPAPLMPVAFPGRRVFNFGLPGDRVGNTLWRLAAVGTAHLRPREMVLLLGTNNLGDGDDPSDIARGLGAVLDRATRLWGGPKAVVVTVPRRGPPPGLREADRLELNRRLAALPVRLLDADTALAEEAGGGPSLLPDLLHLSEAGYARLSAAMAVSLDPTRDQSAGASGDRAEAARD